MTEHVDTVVIGGGQAGLAMSYHLSDQGRDHLVLERSRVAEHWRSRVWDSFCLVTPNWTVRLPGFPYDGADPDGFMNRDELIGYLERYADRTRPPLRTGVEVTAVRRRGTGDRYLLDTTTETLEARNVVVATGGFQQPKIPPAAPRLSASIHQLHSSEYRTPGHLPAGGVLVVGTGQSGAQIAEELYQSGRRVYLSVSRCGRAPRRYRGRDTMWWLLEMGRLDQPVDRLAAETGSAYNSHVSGNNGGHDLNLHQFARDGVVLLGRLDDAADMKLRCAPDLGQNLRTADEAAAQIKTRIDEFIRKTGIEAPDDRPVAGWEGGVVEEPVLELDLASEGIATVVWATGYGCDFSWIHLPVESADGELIHRRGVTRFPGLYFLGLPRLHTPKSELLLGVGDDAAFLAAQIASRDQ